MQRLHTIIHGTVQGVSFRANTRERARSLGLVGYVQNLPDGRRVEVLVEGPRAKLDILLNFLHEGPPGSIIEQVEVTFSDISSPSYAAFDITFVRTT